VYETKQHRENNKVFTKLVRAQIFSLDKAKRTVVIISDTVLRKRYVGTNRYATMKDSFV
jgi:hypothetical protein